MGQYDPNSLFGLEIRISELEKRLNSHIKDHLYDLVTEHYKKLEDVE